jgi:hypothetical protein
VHHWFEVDEIILDQVGLVVLRTSVIDKSLVHFDDGLTLNPSSTPATHAKPWRRHRPLRPKPPDETLELHGHAYVGIPGNVRLGRPSRGELVTLIEGGVEFHFLGRRDITQE